MAVFSSNQGLLLLLTGQILAGNTLLPVFLRLVIWALRGLRIGRAKPEEFKFMMNNTKAGGFNHLLPNQQTVFLAASVAALIAVTVTFFCCLNWDSPVFAGLTANQKITNALFMAVNTRQAGENSIDCSLVAPAALVLFITMCAHRNVGLSMGYSCARLPHAEKESGCQDMPYSFSGWWSDQGKVVLVLVMLCGRLKCFHRHRS
ncbi:hypothetical protein ZWY2020_001767 [Hordeum vulgare]|nr:hypothetical protein ZWY2020_001767 [Hordeum vulgare]